MIIRHAIYLPVGKQVDREIGIESTCCQERTGTIMFLCVFFMALCRHGEISVPSSRAVANDPCRAAGANSSKIALGDCR